MTGETEKTHEYIDLEETKKKILQVAEKNCERKPEKLGMIHAAHIVKNMPAADVEPVVHAKWFLLNECSNEGVYCSNCHKKVYRSDYANQKVKSKYCPNCGAKMDGDNE